MVSLKRAAVAAMAVFLVMPVVAHADDVLVRTGGPNTPLLDESVFVLGGVYQATGFGENFHPWDLRYNDDVMVGFGYQKFFYTEPDGFSYGIELGTAGRLSNNNLSGEFWGGVVGRYDGFVINDALRISPSLTFGLSYVTGKVETEATREIGSGDSADVLFYLAPEISFSAVDTPEFEGFVRLQHRSGAWGTLANMDGANATTVGIRHRF